MSSSKLSHRTARRHGELDRAKADRQVAHTVPAHRRPGGRSWINGREAGGTDARYLHLEHTSD
jgi:hypothetical protein